MKKYINRYRIAHQLKMSSIIAHHIMGNKNKFILLCLVSLFSACANIVSPTGGPIDKTAPVLSPLSTPDSVLNFKSGTIQFTFDELIQLKDPNNQIIISPLLKANPTYKVHKRTFTMYIPDSLLLPNTTYQIHFGNAIQDVHEGNAIQNLKRTFSTGSYFDSLSIHGTIIDAESGDKDTSSLVLVYLAQEPDSVIKYQKPLYVSKTAQGVFTLNQMPHQSFKIFALKDLNKNLIYDAKGEKLAFYDKAIDPSNDTLPIVLYTFLEKKNSDTSTKSLLRKEVPSKNVEKLSYTISVNQDTTKRNFDFKDTLHIIFNHTISTWDKSKIRLYQKEELDASSDVILDSSKKSISIYTSWEQDVVYSLILMQNFASDSVNNKIKADTIFFRTKRISDYGSLKIV
ncbi:MAG: Ig-like domain-containing protein [Chitinophagaceae bacterium]